MRTVPTVFLSSTGLDLVEYRDAAIEVCNQLGLVPIAMEFFEAMGAGAVEASKTKLEDADVYVGIFAHRYGYIEPGYDRSVTQLEFEHAGERRLERLCFVVDDSYPWPPDAIDYEHHGELVAFKKSVDKLVRARFTTVDSLRAALMHALVKWQGRAASAVGVARGSEPLRRAPPPVPVVFLGRHRELGEIRMRLGVGSAEGAMRVCIVRGWPGVGKTTLVNALAHDVEVRSWFRDGVLWATLGPGGDAAAVLRGWCEELGVKVPGPMPELGELIAALRRALIRRRMLLIVDDIWETDSGAPFNHVESSGCALLMTTRFTAVANDLANLPGEEVFLLGVLDDARSLELLDRVAPGLARRFPEESLSLVRDLEGLPLAIRVAGRLLELELEHGIDIQPVLLELRNSRILDERAPSDRFDPATGTTPTVEVLLRRSTDYLDAETHVRFAKLGSFAAKPATFEAGAMAFVWRVKDPLPTIRKLVDHGLLEAQVSRGRFQIHFVLMLHARRLLRQGEG